MAIAVCNGAQCMCSFGVAPCQLTATNMSALGGGQPLAVITDNQPVNLSSFGMCSSMANPAVSSATAAALGTLTPQPCSPVIPAPWTPGNPVVLVKGTPILTNDSKTFCTYGGVIQIINPGGGQVLV